MQLEILFPIAAIFILLVLSGFFSGSETALTGASRVRMVNREKEGNPRAAMVNRIREHKDRMIGALLLGNNLVNIMASALATNVLIQLFGNAGVVYATLVMTLLVLIFAEVLPKTYALHHAESLSMRIAPIIRIVIIIFAPITEMVTWIVRMVLKIIGIDISKVGAGSHLELLRGVIEMHQGPEEETHEQRAMLRSILDLADVPIEDVMVHRKNVTLIDSSLPMDEIVNIVLDSPHTRIPVWENDMDNIIGIIHAKLLLRQINHCKGKYDKIELSSIMLEARFVPETASLYDQLQEFRRKQEHFAIVVDEYGTAMGIVTMEDILEEIVGEIDDEHDHSVPGVRKQTNNSYVVDGTVTIRDLNREYEWGLPDEDYSTLAGLILYESQTIPNAGQSFVFHDFRFDVLRRQRNQITKVRVTPPENIIEDSEA